jgi:hypothetical protein
MGMERESTWQRLDAERWVHIVAMWVTTLLTVWACVSLFHAWLLGVLWLAIFPAGIVALYGWLTAEWGRGRAWTWWVWTVLSGLGLTWAMMLLATGSPVRGLLWLVINGGLLLLLSHPDCRARIHESDRPAARL